MSRHRSSAWPLATVWAALIVYASLHPFSGWIWPPRPTWSASVSLLWLPTPYSSSFDLWSNYLAYMPLGFLLAVGWLRGGEPAWRAWLRAVLLGSMLSLCMEWTQILLPVRVPSRIDWYTNSAGALTGATLALLLRRFGLLAYWQLWRDTWFVPHGPVGLALLLSWPVAQLFPPPVPLGVGQALGRLALLLNQFLADTALAGWLPLPLPDARLSPFAELSTIALGVLAPCFIAFEMTRQLKRRLVLMAGAIGLGLAATTLSTALNFGPEHALAWITPPVWPALVLGGLAGLMLAFLPNRVVAACGLVALTALIALVNQTSIDPYFASSLHGWEQGRFIRFHGVAQWIGWIWPFAALGFLLARVAAPPGGSAPPGWQHSLLQ
ncbi:MAG: VanZ family protein [Leptothrix sp. (in: b-proteobacteria)]